MQAIAYLARLPRAAGPFLFADSPRGRLARGVIGNAGPVFRVGFRRAGNFRNGLDGFSGNGERGTVRQERRGKQCDENGFHVSWGNRKWIESSILYAETPFLQMLSGVRGRYTEAAFDFTKFQYTIREIT